jgi:hypothetical protein
MILLHRGGVNDAPCNDVTMWPNILRSPARIPSTERLVTTLVKNELGWTMGFLGKLKDGKVTEFGEVR